MKLTPTYKSETKLKTTRTNETNHIHTNRRINKKETNTTHNHKHVDHQQPRPEAMPTLKKTQQTFTPTLKTNKTHHHDKHQHQYPTQTRHGKSENQDEQTQPILNPQDWESGSTSILTSNKIKPGKQKRNCSHSRFSVLSAQLIPVA